VYLNSLGFEQTGHRQQYWFQKMSKVLLIPVITRTEVELDFMVIKFWANFKTCFVSVKIQSEKFVLQTILSIFSCASSNKNERKIGIFRTYWKPAGHPVFEWILYQEHTFTEK